MVIYEVFIYPDVTLPFPPNRQKKKGRKGQRKGQEKARVTHGGVGPVIYSSSEPSGKKSLIAS